MGQLRSCFWDPLHPTVRQALSGARPWESVILAGSSTDESNAGGGMGNEGVQQEDGAAALNLGWDGVAGRVDFFPEVTFTSKSAE